MFPDRPNSSPVVPSAGATPKRHWAVIVPRSETERGVVSAMLTPSTTIRTLSSVDEIDVAVRDVQKA